MKKIVVKQDVRDNPLPASQHNPLSRALTREFLHSTGELMRRLEACNGSVPNTRLAIEVQLEGRDLTPCYSRLLNRGFVKRIKLVLTGPDEGVRLDGKELMEQEMADYFAEIGLANIASETARDMEAFVNWFEKRLPIMRDYFRVGDFKSNDYEAERQREKQQFRALETALATLQGFDTTGWDEDYRRQDQAEQQTLQEERNKLNEYKTRKQ